MMKCKGSFIANPPLRGLGVIESYVGIFLTPVIPLRGKGVIESYAGIVFTPVIPSRG